MVVERSPGFGNSSDNAAESRAAFDAQVSAWDDYTNTPLGRLRQDLTMSHLTQYLDSPFRAWNVLDVGGGTGSYALPLAKQGHRVWLLDFSAQMLATARQKARQLDFSLIDRIDFCHASAQDIPSLFSPDHFDLILCHTLLEYVSEPWEILQGLSTVLRPGGLLSLLFVNPFAAPLRWALAKKDLEKARLALSEQVSTADLFGLPRRTFTTESIKEAVARSGIHAVDEYGIRIFADYVPVEELADPVFYARLLALETAASALFPYKLIARYNHLVGIKTKPA
ncbi:MAG: methyltransferase domain-containing protein [Anaerolineae bacterium]|nr:methyltransferase domain-containing protein [Anaerolineae bacterium]